MIIVFAAEDADTCPRERQHEGFLVEVGRQQGGLCRPRDGQAERGEWGQYEDDGRRGTGSDGERHAGERHGLCAVAGEQHAAGAHAIGEGADERAEHSARHELHEHHERGSRGPAVAVGEDEQRQPDAELGRAEQAVSKSDPAQDGIPEGRSEHREHETKTGGHHRVPSRVTGVPDGVRVARGPGRSDGAALLTSSWLQASPSERSAASCRIVVRAKTARSGPCKKRVATKWVRPCSCSCVLSMRNVGPTIGRK